MRPLRHVLAYFALAICFVVSIPAHAADKQPVKVFILAGQSNMVGAAQVRVLEYQAFEGENQQRYEKFVAAPGEWKERDDVYAKFNDRHGKLTVGYGGSSGNIGPELDFGFTLGDYLDEPVLLIKTAWGGKTLGRDFRPPSSGLPDRALLDKQLAGIRKRDPDFPEQKLADAYGHFYREMIKEVHATLDNRNELFPELEGREFEIAGFVWFQGWNEQYVPEFIETYAENLHNLIRDVRKEFGVPNMPFIVGEFGCDGPSGKYVNQKKLDIRKAQSTVNDLPEFKGNALFVPTTPYWDRKIEALYEAQKAAGGQVKRGEITEAQAQAMRDEFHKHGRDKGYHYFGSPQIYCDMGKAFAEGMITLLKERQE